MAGYPTLTRAGYPLSDTVFNAESRIVGGTVATYQTAPYQASIRIRWADIPFGRGHICGGSLINNRTILTAAHCLYYQYTYGYAMWTASELTVVMGTLNLNQRTPSTFESSVSSYVVNKNFNIYTLDKDIAVLKLTTPVPATHPLARPIGLATVAQPNNTLCQISGWGTTSYNGTQSNALLATNVSLISDSICKRAYVLEPGMICAGDWYAGGRDACQGDSGGPLVCKNVLYGVVSWGSLCGRPERPGVYSSVPYYLNWIQTNSSNKFIGNILFLIAPILCCLVVYLN